MNTVMDPVRDRCRARSRWTLRPSRAFQLMWTRNPSRPSWRPCFRRCTDPGEPESRMGGHRLPVEHLDLPSFADKDKVKAALDTYNKDNEAAGATDRSSPTPTSWVALMSSVTNHQHHLVAAHRLRCPISLVVSSIAGLDHHLYFGPRSAMGRSSVPRSIGASKE